MPNAPWGPEDSERNEALRIVMAAAQKRFDEASERLTDHRQPPHP